MADTTDLPIDAAIKEGYVELKTGSRWTRQFQRRYMIVKRRGIINLYQKMPHKEDKPNESLQLQGSENIQSARIHKNRFPIEIIIPGHKKQQKWTFGFDTAIAQQSWLNIFQSVLKYLKAVAHLQEVLTGSNADTMHGQLLIASALADCGQIAKADKIYNKLLSKYGHDSTEVHEQYEIFLSSHCHDIHQAEQHFLRRKKFFCLPKEIIHTAMGQQLMKISQRIQFMETMKDKCNHEVYSELKNIENVWPYYLYSVPTKQVKRARRYVVHFLRETHRNVSDYVYEYSYGDIEQKAWNIMNGCVSGKAGAVKLQARLGMVMDADAMKELASQMYGMGIGTSVKRFLSTQCSPQLNNRQRSTDDMEQSEDTLSLTGHLENVPIQPHRQEWMFPPTSSEEQLQVDRGHKLSLVGSARSRAATSSFLGSDAMDDIFDIVEDLADIEIESDSDDDDDLKNDVAPLSTITENQYLNIDNVTNNIFSVFSKQVQDTTPKLGTSMSEPVYKDISPPPPLQTIPSPQLIEIANSAPFKKHDTLLSEEEDIDCVPRAATVQQNPYTISNRNGLNPNHTKKRKLRSKTALIKSKSANDDVFDVFNAVHSLLDDKNGYHIFPWTLFMLIWITRRDSMSHIVGNNNNVEQIQVILEFVYLFVVGSMIHFEEHPEYALLLQTLYHLSTDRDHEDVQYKMCLSGVRVIADDSVSSGTKYEVCKFMNMHRWLNIEEKEKLTAIRKYFLKGLRCALHRIHDSLNTYYDMVMYTDLCFGYLEEITTKRYVVNEIPSQCHDKVQGQPTWGPRVDNKYNIKQFSLVCQHRKIAPIPRPRRQSRDFDECYMLFCLSLAKKLNPCFQAQIQTALSSINGLVFEHFEEPIKEKDLCYKLLYNELKEKSSPKAGRILDYCKCIISFCSVDDLVKGFRAIDDKFRVCLIVNRFAAKYQNVDNYKYMNVYIICKHPVIRFVKLICEVRLVLSRVHKLYNERLLIKECFGSVIKQSQIKALMKEIAANNNNNNKEEYINKLRSATHR